MKHGSLFSGIGGFDLAAQWMGWENVFHCEWDRKCQALLKKRFPNSIGFGDIKETDFKNYANSIDIISGGFPCQPFSNAGKRKGTEDDRHLWPEMLRAIREIQPSWVVGENVYGLVNWSKGLVFEMVQTDLENEGYEVWPVILPACAVNAPHRRDRIWFIAYRNGSEQIHRQRADREQTEKIWREKESNVLNESFSNRTTTITERIGQSRSWRAEGQMCTTESGNWETSWTNPNGGWPTQSPVCGGNDGVSNRMDRLKQLGNAIVPQVAYQIFKTIEQFNQGLSLK